MMGYSPPPPPTSPGYPPPVYPAPTMPPRPAPGRGWYALAAVLLVASVALGTALVVLAVRQLNHQVAALERVAVPGLRQVYLDHSGTYTIYYETPNAPHRPDRPVRVAVFAPDGSSVAIHLIPASHDETYGAGGHQGVAVATFSINRAGRYEVSVTADSPEAGADLALGNVNILGLVLGVLAGIGVSVVGIVLALVMLVVTLVRRRRARFGLRY